MKPVGEPNVFTAIDRFYSIMENVIDGAKSVTLDSVTFYVTRDAIFWLESDELMIWSLLQKEFSKKHRLDREYVERVKFGDYTLILRTDGSTIEKIIEEYLA